MEKSKAKKQRRAKEAPLKVIAQLVMPERLLPWERDLFAVLLEAIDGSRPREEKADAGVPS